MCCIYVIVFVFTYIHREERMSNFSHFALFLCFTKCYTFCYLGNSALLERLDVD